DGRGPRGKNLHEQPASLRGHHLLPEQLRSEGSPGEHPASGEESGLAHALPLLRAGRAGSDCSIPHPPGGFRRQMENRMKLFWKTLPWLFVALFGAEIVAVILPKHDGEFHVREFGRLPVLLNGRVQPFDSVAHNSLLQIRSTGDLPLEIVPSWKFWHHPKKLK